ncbi:MAG: DsrE family protein [Sterolibacteriaceae bacterium]|nr:DsrE family protein [Sterolibacteriaceae bacterium]
MHIPSIVTIGLLALLLAAPAVALAADAPAKAAGNATATPRMVFQVNEDDSRKWHTVLANINNVQEELGGKVEVAVVLIGPGLGMIKADALTANGVQDAMTTGVRFVACGNSMQSMKLAKDDLVDGVAHARAGYVEIMRLQKLGYAYIRP